MRIFFSTEGGVSSMLAWQYKKAVKLASFSSPSGTPFKVSGFQSRQSRGLFCFCLCICRSFWAVRFYHGENEGIAERWSCQDCRPKAPKPNLVKLGMSPITELIQTTSTQSVSVVRSTCRRFCPLWDENWPSDPIASFRLRISHWQDSSRQSH